MRYAIVAVLCIVACGDPTAPVKKLTPPKPDTLQGQLPRHDTMAVDTTGHVRG